MTGYFWKDPDVNAFGLFTPSLQSGLYHIAECEQMPGIKLWTDGVGHDEIWVNQYTLDNRHSSGTSHGFQSLGSYLAPLGSPWALLESKIFGVIHPV